MKYLCAVFIGIHKIWIYLDSILANTFMVVEEIGIIK